MIRLVAMLKALEADESIPYTQYLTDSDNKLISDELDELVHATFITQGGGTNFAAIHEIAKHGYTVSCGEKDSFGWLSGVLHTKKGRIVYG